MQLLGTQLTTNNQTPWCRYAQHTHMRARHAHIPRTRTTASIFLTLSSLPSSRWNMHSVACFSLSVRLPGLEHAVRRSSRCSHNDSNNNSTYPHTNHCQISHNQQYNRQTTHNRTHTHVPQSLCSPLLQLRNFSTEVTPTTATAPTSTAATSTSTTNRENQTASNTAHPFPWTCGQVPSGYWGSSDHHRLALEWLGRELGITHWEQWYQVTVADVTQRGLSGLLHLYNHSHITMITSVFSEHQWLPWKFQRVSAGFWDDENNRKQTLEWLKGELGIKQAEDWYSVTREQVRARGGVSLLAYYGGSIFSMLQALEPGHTWYGWKFRTVPTGFWAEKKNHRAALEWLGKQLHVTSWEQWYHVTLAQCQSHGLTGLLTYYNNSLPRILSSVFHEHKWHMWKFPSGAPQDFWAKRANLRTYFEWLLQEHKLPNPTALSFQPASFFSENYAPQFRNREKLMKALRGAYEGRKDREGERE